MAELLPQLYLHGLALGDFDLALRGRLGEEAPLSPATIQRLKAYRRALTPTGRLVMNWLPDFAMIVRLRQAGVPGQVGAEFGLYEVGIRMGPRSRTMGHARCTSTSTRASIAHLLQAAGFAAVRIENAWFGNEPYPVNLKVIADKGKP